MSSSLAARAAEAAALATNGHGASRLPLAAGTPVAAVTVSPNGHTDTAPAELPDIDVEEPGPDGPEQVPVHVAWSRLMGDIRAIRKDQLYNAAGTRFNFRGVDQVVNAFGPIVRKHGILILPVGVETEYRDTATSKGSKMRECTVKIRWMVIGPAGDRFPEFLVSAGEALDSMDKGTAKAQSVALRVLLLTSAMVPTDDPDPDSARGLERGEAPVRSAASYAEEIMHPGTTRERMRQIHYELRQQRMLNASVMNENGGPEQIGGMLNRIGQERFAPPPAAPQAAPSAPPGFDEDGTPLDAVGVTPEQIAAYAAGAVPGQQ